MTVRTCKCGCGTPITDPANRGREYVNPAHRTSAYRERRENARVTSQTQPQRLLALLRERGGLGIHTFELRGMHIANPSQRAADLEALGYTVRRQRERFGKAFGSRYWLTRDAEASR